MYLLKASLKARKTFSNVVGDEAEPYSIELANELISATQQMADVEVIRVEE
jgi:hypothetical protein